MGNEGKSLLVQDGKLTIPLYHGTSSIFAPSIAATGLGGRSIIQELNLREAASALVATCERLGVPEEWLFDYDGCQNIAADPANPRRGSFRYRGVFLTASRFSAANYASLYRYGSEALSVIRSLLDCVSVVEPTIGDSHLFAGVRSLDVSGATPVLIEATAVPVDDLIAEHGGSPTENLRHIEALLGDDDYVFHALTSQTNFELLRPVPPERLRFYRIVRTGPEQDAFGLVETSATAFMAADDTKSTLAR